MKVTKTLKSVLTFLLLTSFVAIFAQDPAQYGTPFAGVPDRMDANIYQLNLREFSATRNIEGARLKLQHIKNLGINVIYLMPIYPVGVLNNPDGSPYSSRDLKSIAPDLGDLAKLRQFVDEAHANGMAVILDWVVNQTSWDHPWITQHPDWYVRDASGNILPPCPAPDYCFNDVAQINLNNSAAAAAMVDAMRYWIFAANIDGFRFDWADKAPQSFWINTLSNLRSITSHKFLFLAEGSNEGTTSGCNTCGENQPGYHYASGFDYIFGTNFYWNVMKRIWNSGEPATNLNGVTTGEYYGASSTQLVARYLSNHDDYNADGSPFSFLNGGRNGAMAAFVVASYHRGVPFIYNGLEVGNTNPLPYPWKNGNINWTQDLTVYTEMQKLLNFRNSSVALRRGQPTSYIDPANTNPDIIAFTKSSGTEKVAVMVNVRNSTRTFTIPAGMAGSYVNPFNSNASVTLTQGATQTLSAYQYIVLTNASVPVVNVTGVSVSPTSASVSKGLTRQLTATVAPSNATNQNVSWSSNNTSVATVNSSGLVTAVNTGTATITCTTQDGNKTATCALTVTAASTFTVYFYKPTAWGTNIRIYWWAAQPAGVLADGSWPGVAMTNAGNNWYSYTFTNVTSTNLIFNDGTSQSADLSRGTNGWYKDGAWYNSQPDNIAVTGVTVSPASGTVAIGSTLQLAATVSPSNASNKAVSWSSSNTGVASVNSNGLVTAIAAGTATITVTTQDGNKTATAAVTVPAPSQTPYGGAAIAVPGIIEVENFDNGGQSVAYYDNDASNNGGQYRTNYGVDIEVCSEGGYNVGWTNAGEWLEYTVNVGATGTYNFDIRASSGASGGTFRIEFGGVDKTGTLTVPVTGGWQNWQSVTKTGVSLTAGTQVMRIYMITGGYNLNRVTITSNSTVAVTSVSVSPTSASIATGATQQLTATVLPSNATNKTVTWTSSNNAVASVNTSGMVTGVAAGSAIITVRTNDGGRTATATITVTNPAGSYYALRNRWTGAYLYDAGANVGYGASVANNSYKWQKVSIDGTYFLLKNVGTGHYMHIENQTGSVQCTAATLSWWSAQWSQDYIDGTWVRFRNRWQTGSIVHVENQTGSAQYTNAQDGWFSAQWQLVTVSATGMIETAIESSTSNSIEIYPNPLTNNKLYVKCDNSDANLSVSCFDLSGKLMFNQLLNQSGFINTQLPDGVYFVKIQGQDVNVTKKLIVR